MESIQRKDEIIEQLNAAKTELQDQLIRLEEKNQVMVAEMDLFKGRYADTLKHTQEVDKENGQIQMKIQKFKEKDRVIEEYQNKVEQLENQLRIKQEEIEAGRKQVENISGMLEAEETKREYLLSEKQEEILKLQDLVNQSKGNSLDIEEQSITIANLQAKLADTEIALSKAKENYEKLVIEKQQLNTHTEFLDAKLKKKDTDSSFLVLATIMVDC
eukprot:TRINITY_DN2433_c0_g1_i20.p3 TRINITY_DN2433_c0_g1~~TRINITY_DN2433_c0_g1_i20.p3  ORF type:complete len:216 (+),score=74.17 TRINITY_DN2433_c0_g1_i20:853-1500(+)